MFTRSLKIQSTYKVLAFFWNACLHYIVYLHGGKIEKSKFICEVYLLIYLQPYNNSIKTYYKKYI